MQGYRRVGRRSLEPNCTADARAHLGERLVTAERQRLPRSAFANVDARVRCPSPGCFGDLVLFPTGVVDLDGVPSFMDSTVCPLCSVRFELDHDIDDRTLYLQVAWLRANPDAMPDDE